MLHACCHKFELNSDGRNDEKHIYEIHLLSGAYLFELWGAQGGQGCTEGVKKTNYYGGPGAYVLGKVKFNRSQTIYLYIGGRGKDPEYCSQNFNGKGGFNGGSDSGYDEDNDPSGGGGGATGIRLINGSSEKSLYSRIIVAAGGSGSGWETFGAPGGNLTGYKVIGYQSKIFAKSDTDQTNGFSLGKGEIGINNTYTPTSGAGCGYYGGKTGQYSTGQDYFLTVSSSGSSYISGFEGCNSVDENGKHTNNSHHYSGIVFYDSKMYNGNTNFLSPKYIPEEGHFGDGAIRITLLSCSCVCTQYNYFHINLLSFVLSIFLIN